MRRILILLLIILIVGGVAALILWEPQPPVEPIEVPVQLPDRDS